MLNFEDVKKQILRAKQASQSLALLGSDDKNTIIQLMADQIRHDHDKIIEANQKDLMEGSKRGLSEALLDRLKLNKKRIEAMSSGLEALVFLADPIGTVLQKRSNASGLSINKVCVPIGVVGLIYESRPNVTADVAGICIKSGNAAILKGGREALYSNKAIMMSLHKALHVSGNDVNYVQLIEHVDRSVVDMMLKQADNIDLIVPRGGKGLIDMVSKNSLIPVLKHDQGICHVYVDDDANLDMATKIIINAKCQRPGVCNAMETLLIHKDIAQELLRNILPLFDQKNVEVRGCERTRKLGGKDIGIAQDLDWSTEYLDMIISIKVVESYKDAISHINTFGSKHSDAIVTENEQHAKSFLQAVDSATVYHNASTRFTDGYAFGMGAEIGISTDKLHARGPVGIEELTTYKYLIKGSGQIRE